MVALPQTYNTADLPDTGGSMPLIPPGQYQAVIVASEMKQTKDKEGQFLDMTVILTQGQYANTELKERLNLINKNPTAVEIAYKTLARISEAVGMSKTPQDSMELHNKPFMVQVETEAGKPYTDNQGQQKQGKDKSIIKKYLPMPGVGIGGYPAPPFPPVQETAPVQQQVSAVPTANPFAPPK